MLSGVAATGGDARALLRRAGVDPAILDDPERRVPIADYAALYNVVVEALQDEGFGLFQRPVVPGTFEFLCRGVLGSSTLGQALERAARFLAIALPDLEITLTQGPHAAWLFIRERRPLTTGLADPRRVFAFEWLLRLLHGLACWLAARGLALERVDFPFPRPPHAGDYVRVYSEQVSFDSPHLAARFDAALLGLPIRRDGAELEAFLEGAPGKISMLYRRDRETARAVREILARDLSAATTLEDAAAELGVSPRTLHRRLHEEGENFRSIKDILRKHAALAYLGKPHTSVAETATLLGYSEPSAFFRAFQGWTGMSPSAWQRRNRLE